MVKHAGIFITYNSHLVFDSVTDNAYFPVWKQHWFI